MMMHLIVGLGQRIYIVFKSWQPYLDLCKNEEEEEEIIAQFFSCHLVIIHGMQGQEYGTLNEMSGWLRRRKGKETRKFPTALSPALTSPPISRPLNLASHWTSPLTAHGHSSFNMTKTEPAISPAFSQTFFSSSTSHVPTSRPSQNRSDILDSFYYSLSYLSFNESH